MSKRSTRERVRQRRKQEERRKRLLWIIGATVVALVIVAVLILLSNSPSAGTVDIDADYSAYNQEIDRSGEGIGFAIGPSDAPVTLVDFSDFSCPHCHDLAEIIHQLIEEYVAAGSLRVVYKPLAFLSPYSRTASEAAICAGNQGKFWEMHDHIWAIYEASGAGAYTQNQLVRQAEALELNVNQFRTCLASSETAQAVQGVAAEAQVRGINGTPTVFVNGQQVPYRGADTAYGDLKAAIESALGN